MDIELSYKPQPKQNLLHGTIVKQILYGGAAGGGKSHSMRWDAYQACLENPGLDAYLFRRTRTELENTHIKKVRVELRLDIPGHEEDLGRYNETRNRYEFTNGSFLNMCYAEHEQHVYNYDSVEFHWLGIDQAEQFTPFMLDYLKTRMRIGAFRPVVPDMFPRLILSANPGNIAHHYLKEIFIKDRPKFDYDVQGFDANGNEITKTCPMAIFHDESMVDPMDESDPGWRSAFIPAGIPDNDYLDKNYAAAFGRLPEWRRKQLIWGDWDVVPGAYFECWNPKVTEVEPFEVPRWWTCFRSIDWGFSTPFWYGEILCQ